MSSLQTNEIILGLRIQLQEHASPEGKESFGRFFKEPISCYGIKSADLRKIAQDYRKMIHNFSKKEIRNICEELWKSGKCEENFVASYRTEKLEKLYTPEDFELFFHRISTYINNWASCDTFCNHSMGNFLMHFPQFLPQLFTRTKSPKKWVRRAAAVSLIIPAKKGMRRSEIFQIVDALLMDQDDMVQKGYGWLLKVASQVYEEKVFAYVMKHKDHMPRTALRYAIEKLPEAKKRAAMKR